MLPLTRNRKKQQATMPSNSKRQRAASQTSPNEVENEYNATKTPRLSNVDSHFKYMQILDKRLEKQTDNIMFLLEEFKTRIFDEMFKRMEEVKSDLIEIRDRVEKLETVAEDVVGMKKEIKQLKSKIQFHENSTVASDIRITGVPFDESENENLPMIFKNLCNTINIEPLEIKSIFRVKHFTNLRNVPDPPILVRLNTPYERNFFLRKCAEFKRFHKTRFCLRHVGYENDRLFFVNENLTPSNYNIFKTANGLRKNNRIKSAYTNRGIVHIKQLNSDEPVRIDDLKELDAFFRESSSDQ